MRLRLATTLPLILPSTLLCVRHLTMAAFIALLTGCSLQSAQLDTALSLLNRAAPVNEGWTAQLGRVTRPVLPEEYDGLLFFANDEGDAVSFDGWTLRAVVGFGLPKPLGVLVAGTDRRYFIGGRSVTHPCTAWQKNDDTRQWQQNCVGQFSYKNYITLDTQDRIIGINQVVGANGTRLIISKH